MPHFTNPIDPGGAPLVQAVFHISFPRFVHMSGANVPIPDPFVGLALLDTGASVSCLDPSVIEHLQLQPRNMEDVLTPSTGNQPHLAAEYDVSVVIFTGKQKDLPLANHCMPIVQSELLLSQRIHALIGRDILRDCIFNYNGNGYFSLSW